MRNSYGVAYWLVVIVLVVILWPILKWLLLILLAVLAYIFYKSYKHFKAGDKNVHYEQRESLSNDDDIIDVKVKVKNKEDEF